MDEVKSQGVDNRDMVDSLVRDKYIKKSKIEYVFRVVDRGDYYLPEHKMNAYKIESAYKSGNIHMSSPTIYCNVVENLNLCSGLSFLNIGSGTGYLSTLVGLLIGPLGVNHGVEIYEDVVEYARQKLWNFKIRLPAVNCLELSEPEFVKGNGLCLGRRMGQYDRVYCGATCPDNFKNYMKDLIKVGGILVMPLGDKLLQITRISEGHWEQKNIVGVTFAHLQLPSMNDERLPIHLPLKVYTPECKCKVGVEAVVESSATTSQTNNDSKVEKLVNSVEDIEKNELLENFKKVTKHLQEVMECPICYGALDSDLIQCKNGHGTCSTCASKVDRCPTCKQEFVVHQSTLLRKLFECLPKLCCFVEDGCSVIVLDKDHENFCKFRPSVCRNALCGWSGCVKYLVSHVKTCGKSTVCEIPPDSKQPQFFTIDKTQNLSFYTPILFQNQLFWGYFHRNVTTKRISYKFYHVAASKPTIDYYFKVSFKKGKIEYTNSYKAFLDLGDGNDDAGDETGLILPDSELERFQSLKESGKYEYSIEVVTDEIA